MDFLGRAEAEKRLAKVLADLHDEQRQELLGYLGTPPNALNVPSEVWQKFEYQIREKHASEALMIYLLYARQLQDAGNLEFSVAQLAPAAFQYAGQSSAEFSRGAIANTRLKIGAAVDRFNQSQGTAAPWTSDDFEVAVGEVYSPERAETQAITQTTDTVSAAGSDASSAHTVNTGTVVAEIWRTERDGKVCPICSPLEGTDRETWSQVAPTGPTAHPRCRCWIDYRIENGPPDDAD